MIPVILRLQSDVISDWTKILAKTIEIQQNPTSRKESGMQRIPKDSQEVQKSTRREKAARCLNNGFAHSGNLQRRCRQGVGLQSALPTETGEMSVDNTGGGGKLADSDLKSVFSCPRTFFPCPKPREKVS